MISLFLSPVSTEASAAFSIYSMAYRGYSVDHEDEDSQAARQSVHHLRVSKDRRVRGLGSPWLAL